MRDVKRCVNLEKWFRNNRIDIAAVHNEATEEPAVQFTSSNRKSRRNKKKKKQKARKAKVLVELHLEELVSLVLALALSYHTRLASMENRANYRRIFYILES